MRPRPGGATIRRAVFGECPDRVVIGRVSPRILPVNIEFYSEGVGGGVLLTQTDVRDSEVIREGGRGEKTKGHSKGCAAPDQIPEMSETIPGISGIFREELGEKYNIPVVPVNHMEGHIYSIFPKKSKTFKVDTTDKKIFPMLSLLISGGHTELVLVKEGMKYKKLGQTRDDASGEAFDKVARMLGLPYPGGPEISKLANEERTNLIPLLRGGLKRRGGCIPPPPSGTPQEENFKLPRPMMYSKDYDFSFSGLKTAVLYLIRDLKENNPSILDDINIKQKIAREFEDALVETLVYKTIKAIKEYKIKTLIVGGGVSANTYLQEIILKKIKELKQSKALPCSVKVHFPIKSLTGDNAIMIAIAGYYGYLKNKNTRSPLKANGNLTL